jgi:glycine betaine/proline transport system substrate-binding protein
MQHLRTSFAMAVAFVLGLSASTLAKDKVVLGELSWDGSRAITYILQAIIENRLGHEVTIVQAESAVIFAAMDKGDGSIDVYTDLWMPNQSEKWAKYIEKGSRETVLVNDQPYTGTQGLFVPGYIQDTYGIKSVRDLLNPKIAKLFDSDGNGKGEYWPGGPGWNSTNVEQVKAKSYGYDKYFEPYIISDSALKAKLKADYRRKKGILFYYWTPEWIHAIYDLRRLEEPPFDGFAMASKKGDPRYNPNGCWNMIQPKENEDWLAKSEVTCAWPDAKVYVAFAKSLTTRAPKVAQFLKQVAFDPTTVNNWILQIGQQKRDPAEVAKEWVANHSDIVNNQWLAGIRQ